MNLLLFVAALGMIFKSLASANVLMPDLFSRSKRMVGGEKSTIEEFPYLVALERNSSQICGGAIISPYHIVTAAHCFEDDSNRRSYQVRAGSSYLERDGSVHRLQTITLHNNFTGGNDNDLAVIQLEDPIDFDHTKQPIDMFDFGKKIQNGSSAVVAGWGIAGVSIQPQQLRSIELNILDKKTCNEIWTEGDEDESDFILQGHICAWNLEKSKSVCNGDSGGPLVIDGRLAGIVAFMRHGCKSYPMPNVFTRVAHYRDWIDEKIQESGKTLLGKGNEPDNHFTFYFVGIVVSVIIFVTVAVFWSHHSLSFKAIAYKVKWSRTPAWESYEMI